MGFGTVLNKQPSQTGFGAALDADKATIGGFGAGLLPKPDLRTSEGLEQLTEQVGLEESAQRILAGKGEKPKEIFSGGLISDTFDTLNMLQYGVTGLLKGKSFAEGVKTRQSFSDQDALGDLGLPGVIGGIALDIAVDPLTYIPPIAIAKRVPGLFKGVRAVGKAVETTRIGQKLGRAFVYRFGQDPIYREIAERTTLKVATETQNLLDIARPLTALDSETQKAIALARKAGKLEDLPRELLSKAKPAFDELDRLGKEAVEAGLLKKEIYEQNVGKYIARLYKVKEAPEGITGKIKTFFDKKPLRIDLARFKKRTDIPEDVREAMGEILEAGYPTAKGLVQLTGAIERAKFFKEVSLKWGREAAEEGFQQLPKVATLGELTGKYVPTPIYDDIQEIIRVKGEAEKVMNKIVAGFKFGKVVMNPATHARNIMSNFLLNDFEGLSPVRLDIYGKAAREIARKSDLYKEAQKFGLGLDTFAAREIKDLLTGPESTNVIKKYGRKFIDTLSTMYQKEEEWAKMAQYMYQKSKGLSPEEAWKIAERATFNYAQVTPFIRRLRESIFGFPFITFTYKATPQVAKTLVTKPTKISNIGKIKQAIENQADLAELEAERATEPDWIRDGFYLKLPFKDKFDRSAYLDLTYILPFGDLISGQFFERGIERETGLPEAPVQAQLRRAPFINLVRELARNQDFFGNKIWKASDSQEKILGDVLRHVVKTYAPAPISEQIPGGYRKDGTRRQGSLQRVAEFNIEDIEAGGLQSRTLFEELLRYTGLKISPVDLEMQAKFSEAEKRRALETLLLEQGEIGEFRRPFIPKE